MTCKDCCHYDVCEIQNEIPFKKSEKCRLFKDKSKFIELPCKVGEAIDTLFSHNEIISLWYNMPNDKDHSFLLWKGEAWNLPEKYKEQRVIKFKGIIPETISEADTLNMLITPYIITKEEAEQALKESEENVQYV